MYKYVILIKVIILKNLLVIFGGYSSEHDISLRSVTSVLKNLNKEKYAITMLGITKDGAWLKYDGSVDDIESGKWLQGNVTPAVLSPDRTEKALLVFNETGVEKIKIDVIFPVLHGKNGEDGTIQGLFQLADIPFVGCDLLSSSMCMDKAITNTLADAAGIDGAKWSSFTKTEYYKGNVDLDKVIDKIGFPIFVKPANAGSSVGISKAHNLEELKVALDIAFKNDYKAVLEETLTGREVECAVMGNAEPIASCIGEILPTTEFYDFDAKYVSNSTGLSIPADLPEELSKKLRDAAVNAYKTMGCEGLSRVDFFLSDDGTCYLNEINTLPGFTSISMFPKLFEQVGVPYSELLDKLIEYAEARSDEK